MDYERLASELLRHLRGKRSQVSFSRRMGYSTNAAHTWETGKRFPATSVFLRAVSRQRPGFKTALVVFEPRLDALDGVDFAGREGVAALLRALRGELAIGEVAAASGVNRATMSRWLNGEGEPRVPELLRCVQACTQRLLEFVALFAPPDAIRSTRRAWQDLQAQLHVAYELPWSHAVLRVLETERYLRLPRHVPGFIARELDISLAEERRALAALVRAKQVRRAGSRYRVRRVLTVDTRRDPERNRMLKEYWAAVGLQQLRTGRTGLFSYNVFVVSEEDSRRLRALHLDYFERMRAIVAASPRSERVMLVNAQLMSLSHDEAAEQAPAEDPNPSDEHHRL